MNNYPIQILLKIDETLSDKINQSYNDYVKSPDTPIITKAEWIRQRLIAGIDVYLYPSTLIDH
jgi:hypothetical protein